MFGGYDVCGSEYDYKQFKGAIKCAKGFVLNPKSFNCYKYEGYAPNFKNAKKYCKDRYSEILNFDGDNDAIGFMSLLQNGKNFKKST